VKPLAYINKPLGVSSFPCEIFPVLKCMAEKKGDLVSFKRHERGGHFAALERPGELWGDVVEFVGRAWKE
jgi:microsomal epoxide hydrolase